jgi:hypothetical protein
VERYYTTQIMLDSSQQVAGLDQFNFLIKAIFSPLEHD